MEISKELKNEIWEYCRLNDITNVNDFMIKLLKQGFTVEKFGATPTTTIVEKIVEKIVEVPIEREVFVTDDTTVLKLSDELNRLTELNKEQANIIIDLEGKLSLKKTKDSKDIYGEG
jgi:hypothetical protein